MKRIFMTIGLVLVLIAILIPSVPVLASQGPSNGSLVQIKRSTSRNWAGYAEALNGSTGAIVGAAGSVTDVKGQWTVPAVTGLSSRGSYYSSAWVGIDGYGDTTVEQIGTEQDWNNGRASYYAWFEMYPQGAWELLPKYYPVSANDSMTAEVAYIGNGKFTLSLSDTRGGKLVWSFSTTQTLRSAKEETAEWIMEAPSSYSGVLPLADFTRIYFSNCSAVIDNNPCAITTYHYDAITMMIGNGAAEATPSILTASASSFNVTLNSSGAINNIVQTYQHGRTR